MSPALGSHLLATDTESFPALGSLSLACHSGLVHVLGCGAEGYEDLLLPPTNQKPLKHKSVPQSSLFQRRVSHVWSLFLVYSPNKAQPQSFLGTPGPLPSPWSCVQPSQEMPVQETGDCPLSPLRG